MRTYVLKRFLLFIPSLIIISLLAFTISVNAPGDPVDRMITGQSGNDAGKQYFNQAEQRKFWRKKLGLDLPVFYFSLRSASEPDTLYRIERKSEQQALKRLCAQFGSWKEISRYYISIKSAQAALAATISGSVAEREKLIPIQYELASVSYGYDENVIASKLNKLNASLTPYPDLKKKLEDVKSNFDQIKLNQVTWKKYLPALSFHFNNQYHRWLFGDGYYSKGIIRGDFGISYSTRQPVSQVIGQKIKWSLFFSLFSVLLAYLISIPIGAWSAAKRNGIFDKTSSVILFTLFSLPIFWTATLLVMLFANPDAMKIFPASGVMPVTGYPEGAGFLARIKLSMPYLILPTICYTYSAVAFLSRTVRTSMLEQLGEDYIRTARAKGLSEYKVIFKHALRNSLLPMITLFANIFPLAIGGSVILETIFTIPGMGYETVFAIQNQNHPLIIAIFMITGFLTMVGFLIADLLYAFADPRIAYK